MNKLLQLRYIVTFVVLVFVLIAVAMLYFTYYVPHYDKEHSCRAGCCSNLTVMHKAIKLYSQKYGCYPHSSGRVFLNCLRGLLSDTQPNDMQYGASQTGAAYVFVCPSTGHDPSLDVCDYNGPSLNGLETKYLTDSCPPNRIIAADASINNHLGDGGWVLRFSGKVEWLDKELFIRVDTVEK